MQWLYSCVRARSLCLLLLVIAVTDSWAFGTFRDGQGTQSVAQGGINTVGMSTPLAALTGNPAQMFGIGHNTAELNAAIASFNAEFTSKQNEQVTSSVRHGLIPAGAVVFVPANNKYRLGFSLSPDIALETDYRYVDPAGGLNGVSYGLQQHSSMFVMLNARLAAAYALNDKLQLAAAINLAWNRNELAAPYIFQQGAPSILPGFKALLDLAVEGEGIGAHLGMVYQINNALTLGLSYQPEYTVEADGRVTGDASAQLAQLGVLGFNPRIDYDVAIDTTVPAVFSMGLQWQTEADIQYSAQLDYVGNEAAYDFLSLQLSNGRNADLNALLGANGYTERTPLAWDDQYILRVGADMPLDDSIRFSFGIALTNNPIPASHTTPLTAAISKTVFSLGVAGVRIGAGELNFAYQHVARSTVDTANSALLGGEYSNTSTSVGGNWFGLSYLRRW